MLPPLKPGAKLLEDRWSRDRDGAADPAAMAERRHSANTAMLSDPGTARFITPDGIAITTEIGGWRNAAVISGHWALHGFGMFAVEEKSSRRYVGRVGPWCPPGWPGFEVGWGIANGIPWQGLRGGSGAGRRSTGCSRRFEIDEIIHCIEASNATVTSASRGGWGRGGMAKLICSARPMSAG